MNRPRLTKKVIRGFRVLLGDTPGQTFPVIQGDFMPLSYTLESEAQRAMDFMRALAQWDDEQRSA